MYKGTQIPECYKILLHALNTYKQRSATDIYFRRSYRYGLPAIIPVNIYALEITLTLTTRHPISPGRHYPCTSELLDVPMSCQDFGEVLSFEPNVICVDGLLTAELDLTLYRARVRYWSTVPLQMKSNYSQFIATGSKKQCHR